MPSGKDVCSVCTKCKEEADAKKLFNCTGCKARLYCGQQCQKVDWPTHKKQCKPTVWYDKYRKCGHGGSHEIHEGRLELITWPCPEGDTGWGACFTEESDGLRHKFETEFRGDLKKFYKYWPQGFRWTCCGCCGSSTYGCDHHGTGSKPCTCDFCRMGKPVSDKIHNEKVASRMGLTLPKGPDPRSYNPLLAMNAEIGRSIIGMDEDDF